MFGDKPIVGCQKAKMDTKGRITIPMFSGIQAHESGLVISRTSPVEGIICVQIQKADRFSKRIAELKKLRDTLTDTVEIENAYRELVNLCIDTDSIDASVDGQNRMLLPAKLRKDVFGENAELMVKGAYDSLYIFPSEDAYNTFMEKRLK